MAHRYCYDAGSRADGRFQIQTKGQIGDFLITPMFTHDSKKPCALIPDLETPLSGASAPLRVLVVDDDPATGQLLSLVGEREGFQVVTIDDGRNAYRMLKSDANFAAAVFNMTMASLKGLDLVRHMKTEKRLM